jgi:outer membrane protein
MISISIDNLAYGQESESPKESKVNRQKPKGFLYGAAVGVSRTLYTGTDEKYFAFPVLGYRNDKLFVFGPFVSYEVTNIGKTRFSLKAKPRLDGYKESDSAIFKGMFDRKPGIDIGLELQFEKEKWKLGFSGFHDVLDRSSGSELSISLGKALRYGPFFIEPELKLDWQDQKLVDYYYGVRRSEATVLRSEYDPKSALNASFGVTLSTPIFFGGLTRLSFKHTQYDTNITRSPLVNTDATQSVILSFSRFMN